MVVSSEGYFYSYSIDLENGGECSLMKQYSYVLYARILLPGCSDVLSDYLTLRTRLRMIRCRVGVIRDLILFVRLCMIQYGVLPQR